MKRTKYKINPSLAQYGYSITEGKRTIRTQGTRIGIVAGEKATIAIEERVKEYEDNAEYFKATKNLASLLPILNTHGINVLSYVIINCLEFNKDRVIIFGKDYCLKTRMSLSSFSRGLSDLLDNEVIYETDMQSIYFINITLFHKGDLRDKYKEFTQIVMR